METERQRKRDTGRWYVEKECLELTASVIYISFSDWKHLKQPPAIHVKGSLKPVVSVVALLDDGVVPSIHWATVGHFTSP
jgi:hypothetical protein